MHFGTVPYHFPDRNIMASIEKQSEHITIHFAVVPDLIFMYISNKRIQLSSHSDFECSFLLFSKLHPIIP